jgi:ATP synthase protein I
MLKDFFNLKNDNDLEKGKKFEDLGKYLGLGLQLALTVLVMVFLGIWLDEKFNTKPWLMVVCSFLGIFAALYSFIKMVLKSNK